MVYGLCFILQRVEGAEAYFGQNTATSVPLRGLLDAHIAL